jgi:hypothetical protein
MLRIIQGVDQRLDALLCGGTGNFVGVELTELGDRSSRFFAEAVGEFNIRPRDKKLSFQLDASAADNVVWRYQLEFGGERRFSVELQSNGKRLGKAVLLLRFSDLSDENHTKVTEFTEDEFDTGGGFKGKLFWCFENVVGWSMYEAAFVRSWNEYADKSDGRVSQLLVKKPSLQLGSNELDEFSFKYNGKDRFFISLKYDDKRRRLCVELRDSKNLSYWRNFHINADASASEIMSDFLDTADMWSR